MAAEEKEKNNVRGGSENDTVTFVSICCDQLDGAREIIEKEDNLKWPNVQHYYMDPESKEIAKSVLGFSSVPFYVMLNAQGKVTQKGNKVEWTQLPSSASSLSSTTPPTLSSVFKTLAVDAPTLDQENQPVQPSATGSHAKLEREETLLVVTKEPAASHEQAFVLDDLDF
jgi:hypothetical protein